MRRVFTYFFRAVNLKSILQNDAFQYLSMKKREYLTCLLILVHAPLELTNKWTGVHFDKTELQSCQFLVLIIGYFSVLVLEKKKWFTVRPFCHGLKRWASVNSFEVRNCIYVFFNGCLYMYLTLIAVITQSIFE